MNYIEYSFEISPLQPASDILIAELGELGFESFVENETGLDAYISEELDKENLLDNLFILNNANFKITYSKKHIEQVNWNKAWESNFDPIVVGDECRIYAPFHNKGKERYQILIEPKMSFGTGHHATTYLMLQHILKHDFENKTVLDMGCGTAVLAILAEMRGATSIDAIDIDEWCFENSKENIVRNNCNNITPILGDSKKFKGQLYDIVIANINRNILLEDIPNYKASLNLDGLLFLSGFYIEDLEIIKNACKKEGLEYVDSTSKDNWIAAKFTKTA